MLLSARKRYAHDQRKEIDEASAMILSNFRQGEVDAQCRSSKIHWSNWNCWVSSIGLGFVGDYLAKATTGSGLCWSLAPFVPLANYRGIRRLDDTCSSIAVLVEGYCHLDFDAFALLLPARHVIKRGGGSYNDLNCQVGRLPPLRSKCLSVWIVP